MSGVPASPLQKAPWSRSAAAGVISLGSSVHLLLCHRKLEPGGSVYPVCVSTSPKPRTPCSTHLSREGKGNGALDGRSLLLHCCCCTCSILLCILLPNVGQCSRQLALWAAGINTRACSRSGGRTRVGGVRGGVTESEGRICVTRVGGGGFVYMCVSVCEGWVRLCWQLDCVCVKAGQAGRYKPGAPLLTCHLQHSTTSRQHGRLNQSRQHSCDVFNPDLCAGRAASRRVEPQAVVVGQSRVGCHTHSTITLPSSTLPTTPPVSP